MPPAYYGIVNVTGAWKSVERNEDRITVDVLVLPHRHTSVTLEVKKQGEDELGEAEAPLVRNSNTVLYRT